MFVEIKGVQFVNKGAELMLYAVLEKLSEHLPDAKIVLEPGVNSPYEKRCQLSALQKFSIKKGKWDLNWISYYIPGKLRNWLIRNFGIITEADIDVVLDASGFAYGDQWSALKTKQLCNEILRGRKNRKKFILLPQALGPFSRQQDKQYLNKALPQAALVCAREETSLEHVKNVTGQLKNLVQFADFTNLVKPIIDDKWRQYKNLMLVIPNYNMVSKRNADSRWAEHYIEMMAASIRLAEEKGLTPVILNHEGKEDEKICEAIKQRAGSDVEIYHESDSRKVKGIIASAKLVVCSRFHGCVSALCQGVPVLGTSWSHKYERLFEEYQLSACLLEPDVSPDTLAEKMDFALESSSELSKESRESYKVESEKMWNKVFNTINAT